MKILRPTFIFILIFKFQTFYSTFINFSKKRIFLNKIIENIKFQSIKIQNYKNIEFQRKYSTIQIAAV